MEKQIITKLTKNFEDYAHQEKGITFWFARDLQNLLGYDKWENFLNAIEKAKEACKNYGQDILDHFPGVRKTIAMPKGATKEISDYNDLITIPSTSNPNLLIFNKLFFIYLC